MPDDAPAPRKRAPRRTPAKSSKPKPRSRARKSDGFTLPAIHVPPQVRTTLILLVVTVGLGTYISLYELRRPTTEELTAKATMVAQVPEDQVTGLALDLPKVTQSFAKTDEAWRMNEEGLRADVDRIRRILGAVDPLRADQVLAPASAGVPLDPAHYGLNPPVGTITFLAGDTSTRLLLGEATPVPGQRYAKLETKPDIFIIPDSLFTEANQTSEAFRDPLLLRFDNWSADQLAIASTEATFEVARTDKTWRLIQPVDDLADRTEVHTILSDLGTIRIAQVDPALPKDKKGRARSPFEPAQLTATLTMQGPRPGPPGPDGVVPPVIRPEPVTVTFGEPVAEDPKLVYAQRSDDPTIYAVDAAIVDKLKRDPHGLRSTAVMEFFINMITKVQVAQADSTWTVERKDGAWVDAATGKELDTKQVDNWLSSLSDLRLAGFVDDAPSRLAKYDLDPPQAAISVWTLDREQPQQLFIGGPVENTGNRYARIEGRAAVVRLPDFITELLSMDPADFQPIVQAPATP
jgi:hypothetical protein